MREADLTLVEAWLVQPHVARWWLDGSSQAEELAAIRACLDGDEPTEQFVVEADGVPIGWFQWFCWSDYPADAGTYGAGPEDASFDYAIGEPAYVGRGVGAAMIAAMIGYVRRRCPDRSLLVPVAVGNSASRRVLEKNGFTLVTERIVELEPGDGRTAFYRLR